MSKYARGHLAWGICGRSGRKMLLKDMVFDGRYPNMRVDPAWYEPKDPLDYAPRVDDPVALWRPAPDNWNLTAPVLTLEVEGPDYVDLSWTAAVSDWYQTSNYFVYYREIAVDPTNWILYATYPIERDEFGEITSQTLSATVPTPIGETWEFYVAANDSGGLSSASNEVDMTGQYLTPAVLTASQVTAGAPITLDWTASVALEAIVSYDVYVNVNSAGATLLGSFGPAVLNASDPTVYAQGDVVQYFVRTLTATQDVDSNIETVPFIYASVLTAAQAAPGDPVEVSWTAAVSSEAIAGYALYVQVNGGGYSLLTSVASTVFAYTDSATYSDGDLLDYRVTATTASMSANSNVDSLTYEEPSTGLTGTIEISAVQDTGPPFLNAKGYDDPLVGVFPGSAILQNTTVGDIWELFIYCINFGGNLGKPDGFQLTLVSNGGPLDAAYWTQCVVSDSSAVDRCTIMQIDCSFSATDNGDGTWNNMWLYQPGIGPIFNGDQLMPVPDDYTFTFTV